MRAATWPWFWGVRVPWCVGGGWLACQLFNATASITGAAVSVAILFVINVVQRERVDRRRAERAKANPVVELAPGQVHVRVVLRQPGRRGETVTLGEAVTEPKGDLVIGFCQHGDMFVVDNGDEDAGPVITVDAATWRAKVTKGAALGLIVVQG